MPRHFVVDSSSRSGRASRTFDYPPEYSSASSSRGQPLYREPSSGMPPSRPPSSRHSRDEYQSPTSHGQSSRAPVRSYPPTNYAMTTPYTASYASAAPAGPSYSQDPLVYSTGRLAPAVPAIPQSLELTAGILKTPYLSNGVIGVSSGTINRLEIGAKLLQQQAGIVRFAGNQWANLFATGGESYLRCTLSRQIQEDLKAENPQMRRTLRNFQAALISGGGNCAEIADVNYVLARMQYPDLDVACVGIASGGQGHAFVVLGRLRDGVDKVVRLDGFPVFPNIDVVSNATFSPGRIQIHIDPSTEPEDLPEMAAEIYQNTQKMSKEEVEQWGLENNYPPIGPALVDHLVSSCKNWQIGMFDDRTLAKDPSITYKSGNTTSKAQSELWGSSTQAQKLEGVRLYERYRYRQPDLFGPDFSVI